MRRLPFFVSGFLLVTGLWGCGKDEAKKIVGPDTAGAQQEVTLAEQALGTGDVAGANQHFKDALAKDAGNAQANLGAGVTEIYLLQGDPDVSDLIDLFNSNVGGGLPTAPRPGLAAPALRPALPLRTSSRASEALARMNLTPRARYDFIGGAGALLQFLLRSVADPPPISTIQQVIRLKVLPKLAYAEARLNLVETNPSFVWTLPPSVTGLASNLEIDIADVLLLDALINTVQGTLEIPIAYNVSVPNYNSVNAESLFTNPGSDWGTLYADGSLLLSDARGDWLTGIARANAAVASIQSESDDQSDDLIPIAALGTSTDIAEFLSGLSDLQAALSGPVYVRFTNRYAAADSERVNAGLFFTNPVTDLRTIAPDHTFDVNHQFVPDNPLNLPDPTFHGILPDLTNDRIRYLLGIPSI
jgi:hypothetical protein